MPTRRYVFQLPNFATVTQFYVDFPQVTDEEVIAILAASGPLPAL